MFWVYLLASGWRGTLYVGVTSDLVKRVYQHKESLADGFTSRHEVKTLVWFEETSSAQAAIEREKQLKNWKRAWKIALVEKGNPQWRDLYPWILGEPNAWRPE